MFLPGRGTVTDASGGAVPVRFSTGSDIRSASAGDPPGQAFGIGTPSGAGVTPEAEPGALGIRELPEEEKSSSAKSGAGSKKNRGRDAKGGKAKGSGTDAGRGTAAAVAFARAQIGKPYAWGATGPGSFDCSGLVMRAWQVGGVALPRTTWGMAKAGRATTRGALVPGDLVITNGGGHVQLYIGDGKVVHAPGTGKHVTIAPWLLPPASSPTATSPHSAAACAGRPTEGTADLSVRNSRWQHRPRPHPACGQARFGGFIDGELLGGDDELVRVQFAGTQRGEGLLGRCRIP